jgi:hypothetical protein
VKPLSQQELSRFPKEIQEKRQKYKPGLITVSNAAIHETPGELQADESKYLQYYAKHPIFTDVRYLGKALFNSR